MAIFEGYELTMNKPKNGVFGVLTYLYSWEIRSTLKFESK